MSPDTRSLEASGARYDSVEEQNHRERLSRAIGENYELRDLVGQGGFGAVYRAWDRKLDRPVAVKALRHDLFPSPALLQRFDREAKAVAKLRHPNILPIFAVGEGDGLAYMVMPFVEGESLQSRLDRERTLPPAEAARILGETAAALEAAHKLGIVHRDVKPANIMLEGEERRVLLMDFGIAKSIESNETVLTGTGMVMGSAAYMSPEQARGEQDIDGRSDIYSLGALAYEMLCGERPYIAANLHELVYKQVTQKPRDIAARVPSMPVPLGRAVMRCLAMERADRWQTAADLRSSLTDSASHFIDPIGVEQESWLSQRAPYLLMLVFLLYFITLFESITMPGPRLSELNEPFTTSLYKSVVVLLLAALADLAGRIVLGLKDGLSWRRIARFVLGQPEWWQAWYPLPLRVADSVWDRLPRPMKLLRTMLWLEFIVLPSGTILVVFVTPVFERMGRQLGEPLLSLVVLRATVIVAAWAVLPTLGLLAWQARRAITQYRIGFIPFVASFFTLRGSYWQGSAARAMLTD